MPGGQGSGERTKATAAGVYDWWLQGRHHLDVDAAAAIETQRLFPLIARVAAYNRQFLRRAVNRLLADGIRQFLDIGSGYPVTGAVHEIAQAHDPASRVAYVDHDPDTVRVSREILEGNPGAVCIEGDLREPGAILGHPELGLDLDRPVGLLMLAVLQFVPDEQNPVGLVTSYLDRLAPGSHLAISHVTSPPDERTRAIQEEAVPVYQQNVNTDFRPRDAAAITRLFAGTTLLEPGLVYAPDWHPDSPGYRPDDTDEARVVLLAGVGRKS